MVRLRALALLYSCRMKFGYTSARRRFPMDIRYLTDDNGERVGVLLEIEEYERLRVNPQ